MNLVEKHFRKTEKLLKLIDKNRISNWLLNDGYFPEQYVLPPTFRVDKFKLKSKPEFKDINDLPRFEINSISYPKSSLTSREFGIQHPRNYHDIVFWLNQEWEFILKHLFPKKLKIFSYSMPIPVNSRSIGKLGKLRSGRLIYEWITMTEKDLVAEASKYKLIVRSDITNFYNSIYTHSIGWALHGQEKAFKDKKSSLLGNKIDKLVQYANYGRTNGLPVGSALSNLIAELILTKVDLNVSKKLKSVDFLATRFKDDYRILCHNDDDAKHILKVLADELREFNLLINESKTAILELPTGLYRQHDRDFHPFSVKRKKSIGFKTFELTLLKVLDIHREYPGTSIIEKYFSELFDKDYILKIKFSNHTASKKKQIYSALSLLLLTKRESEKSMSAILSLIEVIYLDNRSTSLKEHLKELIMAEIKLANEKKSAFDLAWLIFFSRYLSLGINEVWIRCNVNSELRKNSFVASIFLSKQKIFTDSKVDLFQKPKDCKDISLAKRLAVFERDKT